MGLADAYFRKAKENATNLAELLKKISHEAQNATQGFRETIADVEVSEIISSLSGTCIQEATKGVYAAKVAEYDSSCKTYDVELIHKKLNQRLDKYFPGLSAVLLPYGDTAWKMFVVWK